MYSFRSAFRRQRFEGVTEVCLCLQATELPVLDEDRQLDADSTNAGEQQFEKLTAGLYMGDIARRIMLRCCLLYPCSPRWSVPHAFVPLQPC